MTPIHPGLRWDRERERERERDRERERGYDRTPRRAASHRSAKRIEPWWQDEHLPGANSLEGDGSALELRAIDEPRALTLQLIEETLERGWEVLSLLPPEELHRVTQEELEEYYRG